MSATVIPLLARRRIEAEILARVHRSLARRLGEEAALEVIGEAVEAAAEAAGRDFAGQGPGGPSLVHFATVLQRWTEGGALELREVRLAPETLEFAVTRCAYADLYRSLGLPPALGYTLSCRRDAAFARGYDSRLSLERSPTLAEGAPDCRFRFRLETG